VSLTA